MSYPRHHIPLGQHAAYIASRTGHVKADVLPHTIEAGDPYYIGDVYEPKPSAFSQEWEINTLV